MVLFCDRPAVHAFFAKLSHEQTLERVDIAAAGTAQLDGVDAAVVDVALEPGIGIEVCSELHRRRPDLPVTAVVCCPQAVPPWTLQALLGSGVSAVLDLQASAEEAERLLKSVGRGSSVLHLQLRRDHGRPLQDIFAPGRRDSLQLRLLELIARGLPDREIGALLHVSPHTVKHRVEQLRTELGVRNRTELAAWAGRHGFYA
jgi:DNA-binding NarL/FixJ family response regulator